MRIGFDAKRLYFNSTGLGNYSRSLVNSLGIQYPQHEYLLYTPKFPGTVPFHQQPDMVTFYPTGFHSLFTSWWRMYGLANQVKKDKLDIYHGLTHELPKGIEATGTKTVVTIHDVIFKKYPDQYRPVDRAIYDSKVAHACQIADVIIAISEQTKRDLIIYYKADVNKIKVVYQSCDPAFSTLADSDRDEKVFRKLQLPERYLLYVGSLVERKNIINLLRAFELLKDKNLQLLLIGNGSSYRKEVEHCITEKGLGDRVKIMPKVSNDDLPAIYRQASLFVYPSLYEGFGIPIIEALWSGVPVITTQGGCFPEAGGPDTIYTDTNNPQLLADAIDYVLSDELLRRTMIATGLNYVQRFSPEVIAEQMMQVYETLLPSLRGGTTWQSPRGE